MTLPGVKSAVLRRMAADSPAVVAALCLGVMAWSTGVGTALGLLTLVLAPFAFRARGLRVDRAVARALLVFAVALIIGVLHAPDIAFAYGRADAYWPLLFLLVAPTFRTAAADAREDTFRYAALTVGLVAAAAALAVLQWAGIGPEPRYNARGFAGTSRLIPFRDVLAAALPLAGLATLEARRAPLRLLYATLCVVVVGGLLAADAKMSLFAAVSALAVIGAVHPRLGRRRWLALLLPPVLLAIPVMAGVGSFGDIVQLFDLKHLAEQDPTRAALWEASWESFLAHPWLGTGLGNLAKAIGEASRFEEFSPLVRQLATGEAAVPPNAHSLPLHVLATQGLVGAAAWLLLLGTCLTRYLGGLRDARPGAALGLAALTLLLVSSLTLHPMLFTVRAVPYFLLLGFALAMLPPRQAARGA